MKLHGHEIPEEFVREVEKIILSTKLERFSLINAACAVRFTKSGRALKEKLGAGDIEWAWLAHEIGGRILRRLKKSGRIEYLGRSQGWRVKR